MTRPPGRSGPAWLTDLQARFGTLLRTTLARGPDGARARTEAYDHELVSEIAGSPILSPAAQLAVYNRQYWFRLCRVLHGEYALTARLLGFAAFNDQAEAFLLARAPRGHDIARVADGFGEFLAAATADAERYRGRIPGAALREAAAIDSAFQRLLHAPAEPAYRPSAAEAARLADAQLRPSRRWAVVRESWPLVDLKRALARIPGEDPLSLPAPLEAARSWLLCNTAAGPMMVASVPDQAAQLFELLRRHPVGEALARLEQDCPPDLHPQLPAHVERWLAQSIDLGFWVGVSAP